MSLLISCQSLSKSYSAKPLFEEVSFGIDEGERIGLIGPNGSGKSTLLKLLAGLEHADTDAGTLTLRRNLRVSFVPQRDVFPEQSTPLQVVAGALSDIEHDDHEREVHAGLILAKTGFTKMDQPVEELSGGWRKRLAIARELAREPELLLLDEPTNHLDLEGIIWLEDALTDAAFSSIVVTHDRQFLENVATRVVELSRAYPQGILSIDGPYSEFLRRRAEVMNAQEREQQALASKVRADLKWLSRGAQARRTKAKGRIKDAGQRIEGLADLKSRNATSKAVGIDFNATGRQTRNLLVATNLSKTLGDRKLFNKLDLTLSPGMRLGLLGPNGSGKTTLLRILTDELKSDTGSIKRADGLRIVTFTQHREDLDLRLSLRDALCPVGDTLFYRDKPIHVVTWAQKFLFRTEQLAVSVGDLSGGEQARILIAQLMLQPADLLILDEPTNDLDIPTLEVLEESLEQFPGALVLVTHDRFMLDRLSTHILGLNGRGEARLFADYYQWEAAQLQDEAPPDEKPEPAKRSPEVAAASKPKSKKLSFNEQREWDQIESTIHAAEREVQSLEAKMNDPMVLANHRAMNDHYKSLDAAQAAVATLYERWAELEARQK